MPRIYTLNVKKYDRYPKKLPSFRIHKGKCIFQNLITTYPGKSKLKWKKDFAYLITIVRDLLFAYHFSVNFLGCWVGLSLLYGKFIKEKIFEGGQILN